MKHIITATPKLQYRSGPPITSYRDWLRQCSDGAFLLVVDFELEQYWLPDGGVLELTAIYYRGPDLGVTVSVTDHSLTSTPLDPEQQYSAWAQLHRFATVSLGQALALAPTYIAKPWGQEIWFTGVEQRGVCCIADDSGETPIPWIQAAIADQSYGPPGSPLLLLKILDPVAQAVTGDLYFELHEQKREVYVVTHIDSSAWPDGVGYIRFGFSADVLARYEDNAAFKAAYLAAVKSYEEVRRELDCGLDHSAALIAREQRLRHEMDSFTYMKPLHLGDVVKVPLLMPHSLQHGVRTIEFQTPVYERKIVSFAQRVVTQDHWDTEDAVAQMTLVQPSCDTFEVLQQQPGVLVERIVDFDDFEVRRVSLAPGKMLDGFAVPSYALVMVVAGKLQMSGVVFGAEQALLLPRGWKESLGSAQPTAAVVFLLALPRDRAVES